MNVGIRSAFSLYMCTVSYKIDMKLFFEEIRLNELYSCNSSPSTKNSADLVMHDYANYKYFDHENGYFRPILLI